MFLSSKEKKNEQEMRRSFIAPQIWNTRHTNATTLFQYKMESINTFEGFVIFLEEYLSKFSLISERVISFSYSSSMFSMREKKES